MRALILVLMLLAPPAVADAGDGAGGRMERILSRGRLIVGVKIDYPPWGTVAPDGSIVGLEPDLARDVADRLGVALELVPVTGANRLQRLERGEIDLVIATMGDTAERRRTSDLVLPHYYASGVTLMARADSPFRDWGQLRGRPVCLTEGAYYNRTLGERYLIDAIVFPGNRDALMALRDGRCVGWGFDDTVITRILGEPEWAGYRLAMPTILGSSWAVAVRKGEGDAAWGRFMADRVADWHRSGRLEALQAKWGLPPSPFLARQRALWSGGLDETCVRDAGGAFPAACLGDEIAGDTVESGGGWADHLRLATGIDLDPFTDPFDRGRLLRGAWLTLALSLVAIAGSLAIGTAIAWACVAAGASIAGRLVTLPLRGLVAVARMTPPLLQLYIVFFGLGGMLSRGLGVTPGSFVVAALVLSLYAGATSAALLTGELRRLTRERPGAPVHRLLGAACERAYEGLVATAVNIVKAAGLASTIAVPEVVSAVGQVLAEGGNAATMMNALVLYYFLLVVAVLGLLRAGRSLLARRT